MKSFNFIINKDQKFLRFPLYANIFQLCWTLLYSSWDFKEVIGLVFFSFTPVMERDIRLVGDGFLCL